MLFWVVGVIVLFNVGMLYGLWLWYRKQEANSFGLHLVICENCESAVIAPYYVESFENCENCCTCEVHGHEVKCKTCGKLHWVNKNISGIAFCDGIGCEDKFRRRELKREKEEKLARKEKRNKVIRK